MKEINLTAGNKELSQEQHKELIAVMKASFEANMHRHEGLDCAKNYARSKNQLPSSK